MSHWGVLLVIGKLVADETFRQRFEARALETLAKLCEQGIDLSDTEVAAFLETDPRVWAAFAERIDRRLRLTRMAPPARPVTERGRLTSRQCQVLRGIFEGRTNKQMAMTIGVSESAVKATLQLLFRKMRVRTRAQLVRVVIEGSPGALDWARTAPPAKRTKEHVVS
jgi:DNA-binding NarL/FixJ family response regulator